MRPKLLLSRAARESLAGRLTAEVSVVLLEEAASQTVDAAFISRDVTGLSTKHEIAPGLQQCHDVLRRSPQLQWVHTHSAGADRPIYGELQSRGVAVTTSSGANAEVVAQTALAGVLMLARHLPQLQRAQAEKRWAPLVAGPMPRDLRGQTAVLVGWGPIARTLQPLLSLLGLRVIVVRRGEAEAAPGVPTVPFTRLHEVLPQADWLLLACPLNARTRGLIDATALRLLPPGARLVNVARGEVVVQAELITALQTGVLAGAFLDVFEHEPLPADSPLWALPNVVLTPHSAGHSDGNAARVADIFIDNLQRWLRGAPLLNKAE